ncbi:MAG: fatty acid desaturase [Planctomycetota bacterium]
MTAARALPTPPHYRFAGLAVAVAVIVAWATALVAALLGVNPGSGTWWADSLWILLQTWLYTGLFITAHEAMHGLVAPRWPRLNHAIGWFALFAFAALPYGRLRAAHMQHHATPSTRDDPDYHEHLGPPPLFNWMARFLIRYVTLLQLLIMGSAYWLLHGLAGLSHERLLLFWVAPQMLSTFQLFVVGTWLPHREADGHFIGDGPTKSRTVDVPPALSLLMCFHFGYHYEHHAWPFVPWWRLQRVRGMRADEVRDQPTRTSS